MGKVPSCLNCEFAEFQVYLWLPRHMPLPSINKGQRLHFRAFNISDFQNRQHPPPSFLNPIEGESGRLATGGDGSKRSRHPDRHQGIDSSGFGFYLTQYFGDKFGFFGAAGFLGGASLMSLRDYKRFQHRVVEIVPD